jgi:hypothetical protein
MKKNTKRIHFLKKRKKILTVKNSKKESKQIVEKFVITKENSNSFDPKINYFNEYWRVYYDNEYILAKIKEVVYEMELMNSYVEQLKNLK